MTLIEPFRIIMLNEAYGDLKSIVGVHNQSEESIFNDVSGVLAQGAAGSSEGMGVPLKAAARAAPKKW